MYSISQINAFVGISDRFHKILSKEFRQNNRTWHYCQALFKPIMVSSFYYFFFKKKNAAPAIATITTITRTIVPAFPPSLPVGTSSSPGF